MFILLQTDDCKKVHNLSESIPESTNVTIDTIKGFFNTYLLHKYIVDYMANLGAKGLVNKNWVHQANAVNLSSELLQLQNALNFSIQNLALLVSENVHCFYNYCITLQLNSTCDACVSDCFESMTANATLINAINECVNPVYYVIHTIAQHSEELFKTVNNLQLTIDQSQNDNSVITVTTNTANLNDLCLCSNPPQRAQ